MFADADKSLIIRPMLTDFLYILVSFDFSDFLKIFQRFWISEFSNIKNYFIFGIGVGAILYFLYLNLQQ